MAKSVQGRWGCSNNKAVWRRAYSGGKEDGIEAYKILGQKDEVDKSRVTRDLQIHWSWHYSRSQVVHNQVM